ncbi:MAG: hypothetical protein RMH81_07765 [Thermomicrobium sp.]|nr:hypothetical protein [Thermomicrobium sp.]
MDTLAQLIVLVLAAGLLTGLVRLLLDRLGIAPARPEERTRGIELLLERLRARFGSRR